VPRRQGSRPQLIALRPALPSRRPRLRAPEGRASEPPPPQGSARRSSALQHRLVTRRRCPLPSREGGYGVAPARPAGTPRAWGRSPLPPGRPGRARPQPRPAPPSPSTPRGSDPGGAAPPHCPAPHPSTRAPAARAGRGSASSRRAAPSRLPSVSKAPDAPSAQGPVQLGRSPRLGTRPQATSVPRAKPPALSPRPATPEGGFGGLPIRQPGQSAQVRGCGQGREPVGELVGECFWRSVVTWQLGLEEGAVGNMAAWL